ncbi:MAG: NAD(P)-dependent oxidoreductase [Alphaproteobacteria bacterium]
MKKNKLRPINIVFYSKWDSFEKWRNILINHNMNLYNWPDDFKKNSTYSNINGALVWDPPDEIWKHFPNIKIIQSLGAGVDHILRKKIPENVNIIKLHDPNLSNQMAEYALMSVLMCKRKYFQYSNNMIRKEWNQYTPFNNKDFKISILGYGNIAKLIIKNLHNLGFKINVWGNTNRKLKNINYYFGKNQLHESIKNSSCLISLLPDTEHTKDLIGLTEFKLLNNESYFINIGRGNTVKQSEMFYALKNNILTGAIIDVFKNEPLDKNNELWKLKNILITPHIAGITNATDYTAKLLKENFNNLYLNKSLKNKVNITLGY